MKLKHGVTLNGIQPEIVASIPVIERVINHLVEPTITSATDGEHSDNSLHYAGLALDIRTWYLSDDGKQELAERLRAALGAEFDVVVEPTHIHVEFDPDRTPKG